MRKESLIQEIDKLEKEIETLDKMIHREDLDDIEHRRFVSQPWKPHAGGWSGGDVGHDFGKWTARDNRHSRLWNHTNERARKKEKLDALHEALKYRWNYD